MAEQEDREAAAVIVLDGGSLILSDAALAAPELALGPPALPRPAWVPSRITGKAASAERLSASAVAEQPRLRATGDGGLTPTPPAHPNDVSDDVICM